jgi:CHAD domain-containing protein
MKAAADVPYIMPVFTTRSELLNKRVEQFTRVLQAVETGDVRALHQARVASRRMRELVPMLQLSRGSARKLGRRLTKMTTRLGTVRELDVLLLLIDELHVSGRRGTDGLGRVGVRVSKNRDQARKRMSAHAATTEMTRLARKLERTVEDLQKAEGKSSKTAVRSWRWAIDARVAKRAARLGAAVEEAGALYLPERLHAVRIAVKKLRYAVELSTEASGDRPGPDLRVLKRTQELLGRMHDVQVLIDEARQTQTSLAPPSVSVWRDLDTLVTSLEDDCRRLHAKYMKLRHDLEAVVQRRSDSTDATSTRAQTRRVG